MEQVVTYFATDRVNMLLRCKWHTKGAWRMQLPEGGRLGRLLALIHTWSVGDASRATKRLGSLLVVVALLERTRLVAIP